MKRKKLFGITLITLVTLGGTLFADDKKVDDSKRGCTKSCVAWDTNGNCTQWVCQ